MTKKQLEAELKKAHERIAQLKDIPGELAGSIANDFNNLLVAIVAGTDLAFSELSELSPAREHIETIALAAERCAALTEQLLAYSGAASFFVEGIDPARLLEDLRTQLQSTISEKISMKIAVSAHLPSIVGDSQQLRHLIVNLVDNACEAIGEGEGEITVSGYLGSNDDSTGAGKVILEVSDTGRGLDAATRERMFEPGFTTKAVGTGLGLAAAEGILSGHGASVEIESELGKGTTLRLCFPAVDEDTQQVLSGPADAAWQGSGTILVIDDESLVRAVAAKVLKLVGFKVLKAIDGAEGLECFDRHCEEIVCVLLDLTMPGMGGEEVFAELREKRPDLPILVSSGRSEEAVMQWIQEEESAGFIKKPYSIPELRATLQSMLSGASGVGVSGVGVSGVSVSGVGVSGVGVSGVGVSGVSVSGTTDVSGL